MATKLTFSKLPYRKLGLWTFRVKIEYETGYTPILYQDSENLHVNFEEDLTQEQIDWVTALANDANAQNPDPSLIITDNTYVIYDIWERRDIIAANSGVGFRIWWDSSGDLGPNVMDKILFTPIDLQTGAVKILTNKEKNNLVAAIEAGNGWE